MLKRVKEEFFNCKTGIDKKGLRKTDEINNESVTLTFRTTLESPSLTILFLRPLS